MLRSYANGQNAGNDIRLSTLAQKVVNVVTFNDKLIEFESGHGIRVGN
ncbi:MAG TPA: hypothetical protein VH481_02615 [Nitrososphaeraceae archaeon]|jgi:hypothetical protein